MARSKKPATTDDGSLTHVARALAAADRDAWIEARGALELAWRERPSSRVAKIVASIDARLPREELDGHTVNAREREWHLAAETGDPVHLSKLLHAPWPPHANVARGRLWKFEHMPPSPRISNLLIGVIESETFGGRSMSTLLRQIVKLLLAQQDPSIGAYLTRLEAGEPSIPKSALRSILERKNRPVEPDVDEAAAAQLASIEARLSPRGAGTREALLANVYATPHDDGPREVYADVLVEDHDPRGELIVLQLRRARGERGNLTRERALLREAGKRWFDGLDQDGVAFAEIARGFPSKVTLTAPATFRTPAWATVETLVVVNNASMTFTGSPLLRGVRRLFGVAAQQLDRIELATPELDTLGVFGEAIDGPTKLAPKTLGLRLARNARWSEVIASLSRVPLGRRCTALLFDGAIDQLGWVFDLTRAATRITGFEISNNATLDHEPSRWRIVFADGHLEMHWHGREFLQTLAVSPTVLARLNRDQTARIRSISVVTHNKVSDEFLVPARTGIAKLVEGWPSITRAEILV